MGPVESTAPCDGGAPTQALTQAPCKAAQVDVHGRARACVDRAHTDRYKSAWLMRTVAHMACQSSNGPIMCVLPVKRPAPPPLQAQDAQRQHQQLQAQSEQQERELRRQLAAKEQQLTALNANLQVGQEQCWVTFTVCLRVAGPQLSPSPPEL